VERSAGGKPAESRVTVGVSEAENVARALAISNLLNIAGRIAAIQEKLRQLAV
jgi:hypothetical protein